MTAPETPWFIPSCASTNVHVGCGCSIDENTRLRAQLRIAREGLEKIAVDHKPGMWCVVPKSIAEETLAKIGEVGK